MTEIVEIRKIVCYKIWICVRLWEYCFLQIVWRTFYSFEVWNQFDVAYVLWFVETLNSPMNFADAVWGFNVMMVRLQLYERCKCDCFFNKRKSFCCIIFLKEIKIEKFEIVEINEKIFTLRCKLCWIWKFLAGKIKNFEVFSPHRICKNLWECRGTPINPDTRRKIGRRFHVEDRARLNSDQ